MTSKDVLIGAKAALLDRGWYQGDYCQNFDGSGPVCLYGALRVGAGHCPLERIVNNDAGYSLMVALECINPFIGGAATIAQYNDNPKRTLNQVLTVLDLAISSYK